MSDNCTKNKDDSVWGSKASVLINFKGSIEELAVILSRKLYIPTFDIDFVEHPPYRDKVGTSTAICFDIWLQQNSSIEGYNFQLSICTDNCISQMVDKKMYDISPWLAQMVYRQTGIDAVPCRFSDGSLL